VALTDFQQLNKLIKDSTYILIVFGPYDSGDSLSSALALKYFLEKRSKQVEVASSGFAAHKQFNFLQGADTIKPELSHLQKFTLKVDVSKAEIDTISYDIKDNWLSIHLTPKKGVITKNELRTAQSTFKYDLVISINTSDLEALGSIFINNTDLFYRTPIINIDYHTTNEYYGQVNLIDTTATSAAEILSQLLRQLQEEDYDKILSTMLLTGMIVATKSFKSAHVTPHAPHLASDLIKQGADRELIIQNLYRTRSIATLKLWGTILSRLRHNTSCGLVSATLTLADFKETGADDNDIKAVVDELITNSPEAKIIVLLYEKSPSIIKGLLTTDHTCSALEMGKSFRAQGDRKQVSFLHENTTLEVEEKNVISILEKQLSQPLAPPR
jgi:phosphoesterase RecJ-like protein